MQHSDAYMAIELKSHLSTYLTQLITSYGIVSNMVHPYKLLISKKED